MFTILALLATASAVTAQLLAQTAPPQRCCMDHKFTAILTLLGSVGDETITQYYTSVDYDRKLQATRVLQFNPKTQQSVQTNRVVTDHGNLIFYSITAENPIQCNRGVMNYTDLIRCIPADAEYLGASYVGLPNALPFESWRMTTGPAGQARNTTMAFTTDGCVPIVQRQTGYYSTSTEKLDQTLFWSNYEPNIVDPTIFNIPAACFDVLSVGK